MILKELLRLLYHLSNEYLTNKDFDRLRGPILDLMQDEGIMFVWHTWWPRQHCDEVNVFVCNGFWSPSGDIGHPVNFMIMPIARKFISWEIVGGLKVTEADEWAAIGEFNKLLKPFQPTNVQLLRHSLEQVLQRNRP